MWEIMDDVVNCDECTNGNLLSPPKFELPPPPIPPNLKNFVKCSENEFFNQISNWDNNICATIPVFEESIMSSPMMQALTLVGVLSCILLLVITFSTIYIRRLMNQKNNGCKELKNLVKHNWQHSETRSSENSERNYFAQNKFQNANVYEECGARCNQYKIRRAHDFISYLPTNSIGMVSVEEHCQQQINNTIPINKARNFVELLDHPQNRYNGYLKCNHLARYYNNSKVYPTTYIKPSSTISSSSLRSTIATPTDLMNRGFEIPSLKRHSRDLYSIPYEDFDELPAYSRADTGYGGSSEEGTSNNEHTEHNSRRCSNDSNSSIPRRCDDCTNSNINNNLSSNNSNQSDNYPEYIEIELALHNLVPKEVQ